MDVQVHVHVLVLVCVHVHVHFRVHDHITVSVLVSVCALVNLHTALWTTTVRPTLQLSFRFSRPVQDGEEL